MDLVPQHSTQDDGGRFNLDESWTFTEYLIPLYICEFIFKADLKMCLTHALEVLWRKRTLKDQQKNLRIMILHAPVCVGVCVFVLAAYWVPRYSFYQQSEDIVASTPNIKGLLEGSDLV